MCYTNVIVIYMNYVYIKHCKIHIHDTYPPGIHDLYLIHSRMICIEHESLCINDTCSTRIIYVLTDTASYWHGIVRQVSKYS